MKSFTILCCIFLFSAFVFAAKAEESNETPAEEEGQTDLAVNDEEQEEMTEENDETEINEDESEEDEDEEKRSGYGLVCQKKCWKVCKPKFCTRRVCKQFKCGYGKACRKVTRYRIVKKSFKVNVGDLYYPRIVIKYKTSKVPYSATVCKKVPKHCTRCRVVNNKCGKQCKTVCKKVKCVPAYH